MTFLSFLKCLHDHVRLVDNVDTDRSDTLGGRDGRVDFLHAAIFHTSFYFAIEDVGADDMIRHHYTPIPISPTVTHSVWSGLIGITGAVFGSRLTSAAVATTTAPPSF
jgi:hypothetical protein